MNYPYDVGPLQRRTLRALRTSQLAGSLGQAAGGSAAALLARHITGSDAAAGLPAAALALGAALASLAVSALSLRWGRRSALALAMVMAAAGALTMVAAGTVSNMAVLLAGALFFGTGNAGVMLARYAAADLSLPGQRARAMASVVFATTFGAIVGPNLLAPSGRVAPALGLPALAGPEVLAAAAYLSAAALLITLLRPDPLRVARRLGAPVETLAPGSGRLLQLVARPYSAAGLGAMSVANLVMVGVMTMVPVHLMDMGDGLGVVGGVVSLHIAGMFAPSVLTGRLVDRIGGPAATAVGGTLLMVAGVSGALAGTSPGLLALGMIVLGVGWNISLIGGSALLTTAVPVAARPRLEGLGDLSMGVAAAGSGAISGPLMALGSYATLAVCGAVVATVLIPLALIARRSLTAVTRAKPPPSGPSGPDSGGSATAAGRLRSAHPSRASRFAGRTRSTRQPR